MLGERPSVSGAGWPKGLAAPTEATASRGAERSSRPPRPASAEPWCASLSTSSGPGLERDRLRLGVAGEQHPEVGATARQPPPRGVRIAPRARRGPSTRPGGGHRTSRRQRARSADRRALAPPCGAPRPVPSAAAARPRSGRTPQQLVRPGPHPITSAQAPGVIGLVVGDEHGRQPLDAERRAGGRRRPAPGRARVDEDRIASAPASSRIASPWPTSRTRTVQPGRPVPALSHSGPRSGQKQQQRRERGEPRGRLAPGGRGRSRRRARPWRSSAHPDDASAT